MFFVFTALCCVDLVLKYHLNNDYIYSQLVYYIDFISFVVIVKGLVVISLGFFLAPLA